MSALDTQVASSAEEARLAIGAAEAVRDGEAARAAAAVLAAQSAHKAEMVARGVVGTLRAALREVRQQQKWPPRPSLYRIVFPRLARKHPLLGRKHGLPYR